MPFEHDLFVSYHDADRAWVEGYLLDALEQAGVQCHSEAAFALGVPLLTEFERGIRSSRRTLLVLSPAYLADNQAEFVDLLTQSYGLETATWPVIPLVLVTVDLPPRLAILTRLDATDPARHEAVIQRLCDALQVLPPPPPPRPACPYPGLLPFAEADAGRFYGRQRESAELVERLRLHPFVALIGPSGSGKSSLAFAGLVPALRASGLFGAVEWVVRPLRPGAAPLAALAAALGTRQLGDPARAVADCLAGASEAASLIAPAAADKLTPPSAATPNADPSLGGPPLSRGAVKRSLLLVVDQIEELFTLGAAEAGAFQAAIAGLIEVPDCYCVITLRADYYPEIMASPLWPRVQAQRVEVLPLGDEGLRQAIVQPAEDVGVFVETALVERLLADAADEPGVLPLIQETLVLLWERLERRYLPLAAYAALIMPRSAYGGPGPLPTGLQVALARRADAALATLNPEQQDLARRIFLRLIQFGEGRADSRRQQPLAALRTAGDEAAIFDAVLEHLAAQRLITLSGDAASGERRVDIAHEALIAGWPTLRQWIAGRREAELARRRLEARAADWVRLGRGDGGLLDPIELDENERWIATPDATDLGQSGDLRAFVDASRAAAARAAADRESARALAEAQRALWYGIRVPALALGGAIGAGLGLALVRAISAALLGRTVGLFVTLYAMWGALLGASVVVALLVAELARGEIATPEQGAAPGAWRTSASRRARHTGLAVILGAAAFGVDSALISLTVGSSLRALMGSVLVGIAVGLVLSWAICIQRIAGGHFDRRRWLAGLGLAVTGCLLGAAIAQVLSIGRSMRVTGVLWGPSDYRAGLGRLDWPILQTWMASDPAWPFWAAALDAAAVGAALFIGITAGVAMAARWLDRRFARASRGAPPAE
jgi:hypothetical protein